MTRHFFLYCPHCGFSVEETDDHERAINEMYAHQRMIGNRDSHYIVEWVTTVRVK